jgi:hypothetical protein
VSDIIDEINRVAKAHWQKESWCELWLATGTALCLKRATVWLPLAIGENDPEEMHGFCEHHAGVIIGAIVDQLEGEEP